MRVANLIILSNLSKRYSYHIPNDFQINIGDYVDVIFAKRNQIGLCVSIHTADASDFPYKLSDILSIHTKRSRVPLFFIPLIEWFSIHYCVTEYKALQCIIGLKKHRDDQFQPTIDITNLPELTPSQSLIFNAIIDSNIKRHLLHGVTGSGKTLIYAHLIHATLNQAQSSIMLIPEISLTPQFTSFFSSVFPRVAVVHSGLTPKNKEIIWNQCLRGELDVIIGPRSALFMPLENLGLIIIDEEHDTSYKQDSNPRYYAHEVALQRTSIQNARLVFGSATPSLETYAYAKGDDYSYHLLDHRFNDIKLPKVSILDMTKSVQNSLIHDELIAQIEHVLKNGQRVLLLVNRRGYSSFLKCNSCAAIQMCPSCETSYTYHSDGYFRCHRCLSTMKMTRECSACGKFDVEYYGIAIQKIAYELKHLFPEARLTRIDRDTVKNYTDLQDALSSVEDSDILIGTQMISKGHNFSNVALVGIIGIDTMLNFPDFRSSERMFQLMTQMSGRAGRDMSGSDVYIQTFQPNHYVFSFVKNHDVTGFLNQEFSFREPFNYPPFKVMVNVIFSSDDQEKVKRLYSKIRTFNHHLSESFDVDVVGPKVAPIEKASGYYRHNVFYKVSFGDILNFKKMLINFPKKSGVRCVFDIDPKSLL